MKKLLGSSRSIPPIFKNGLKMKLTLFFIFLNLCVVQGNNLRAQETRVTLNLKEVTVQDFINEVEAKTDLRFAYKVNAVDLNRVINVKADNKPIKEVLQQVFKSTNTKYVIMEKQIILKKKKKKASLNTSSTLPQPQPDPIQVMGKVTDQGGTPLIGAYVAIKGNARGVSTNTQGAFTITAQPQDTLVVSYIGFQTKEVPIAGKTIINIQLKEEVGVLSEFVANGIFKRKAESFTGSAITVDKEQLRRAGSLNIFQALRNIAPSMAVIDNMALGSDPNNLPDLQIRGTSSFPANADATANFKGNYLKNPNQPLFILNGFEATLEQIYDLDINRVASITILKDAASKALYGSKAANGVIVIETERLTGGEVLVTYNASLDIEMPDLTSYNLTNAIEKLEAEKIDGMYLPSTTDPEELVRLQQLYNARRRLALEGLNTDWLAKPLQTGVGQRHAITVELGSEDLRVRGNISYRKTNGAMKGSYRKNIAGHFTTSYRIKNFSFKNVINVDNNNSAESPYGEFSEYAKMNPYWKAVNADGTIPYYAEIGPNGEKYVNPLYNSTLNSKITANYFRFVDNFYLEWYIKPELKLTTRIGIDIKKSGADEFYPSGHTMFENYVGDDKDRKGSYQLNDGESSNLSGDLNLHYSNTFGKHFVFGNIGFNINEQKYKENMYKAEGFPSSRMDNIIFAKGYALDSKPVGIEGIARNIGFLAVGSYMYDKRFLADITLRTSASSQFGNENPWATFWSLGLGWNIHNEKFFSGDVIDKLKIRGSLGSSGSQNFNTNESVATYAYYLESLYQGFPGSYLMNMPNPGLQWQSKFDYDVGLDAKIGNLSLVFDYYESYTKNLVTAVTIPYSTGFNSVKENLGKVKNYGVELRASYLLWQDGKNFFNIFGSVATNKNKILELSDAMRSYNEAMEEQASMLSQSKPVLKYVEGGSLNSIWAVRSLGIDPATGNEIYLDKEGNTTYEWDADNMVVTGNSLPTYRGNFGFNGEYNGIGLSVTARFLGGGQMYNQTLVDKVENVDMNYNVDKRVLTGRWLKPGDHSLFKRLGKVSVDRDGDGVLETHFMQKTRATSRFVQDRNELTIAAVNLYYDFNDKLLDYLGLQRLRLSFNMNDLYTFSSIRIERGVLYPFSRTMSFSLMATF